jgi:hypothetical protein
VCDVELYRAILRFTPPLQMVSVELDVSGQHLTVKADAGLSPFPYPVWLRDGAYARP